MKAISQRSRRGNLFAAAIAMFALASIPGLCVAAGSPDQKLMVTVGQSVTHRMLSPIQSVSIADTKIADVVVANPHEILLNGKAIGFTTLVVWDDQKTTTYDVVVRGPFSDEQIELGVQVAEVNRQKAIETGFDYLVSEEHTTAGAYPGEVSTPQIPLSIFDRTGNTTRQAPGTTFAFRYVHGADVSTMIHLMEEQGVLRILAKPRLVAASGQAASFLSGGEIPVPIASTSPNGGVQITIEWKEFGVGINFLPTIVDSGVINLKVSPKVSNLDFANGIVLSGFSVPAIRTRRADTEVELKDGESLVIGGLIMQQENRSIRRVPVLGRIPLLGFFFRHTNKEIVESELLFVVTAHIVHALPKGTPVELPQDGKGAQ